MYRITKEFHFSASHQLCHLPDDHPCARMHGHNYIIEVELCAEALDTNRFVVDYRDLTPLKRYIDDELDHLIIEGNPATYKQLPDNSTVHDQAKAMRMEYYELKNLVVLIRDAWVKQDTSTLVGERIEYNTVLSRVKAWSRPGGGEAQAAPETEKKSRVKLIIKKKKEDGT